MKNTLPERIACASIEWEIEWLGHLLGDGAGFAETQPGQNGMDDVRVRGTGMCAGQMVRSIGRAGMVTLMMALTGLATSCRAKKLAADLGLAGPNAESSLTDKAAASAMKVGGAGAAIVSACKIEPYGNASKGLIVSETGLREDVLELRDRASYKGVPFDLNETERLETLLRKEIGANGSTRYPADQSGCIREFADHMQTLTDPLVEAEVEQKELDISAFDNASKEAQQEIEEEEKVMQGKQYP